MDTALKLSNLTIYLCCCHIIFLSLAAKIYASKYTLQNILCNIFYLGLGNKNIVETLLFVIATLLTGALSHKPARNSFLLLIMFMWHTHGFEQEKLSTNWWKVGQHIHQPIREESGCKVALALSDTCASSASDVTYSLHLLRRHLYSTNIATFRSEKLLEY